MTSSSNAVQVDANGNVILTPAQQRAADKQAEYMAYLRLLKQVSSFDQHIIELGQNIDVMRDGGKGKPRISHVCLDSADCISRV